MHSPRFIHSLFSFMTAFPLHTHRPRTRWRRGFEGSWLRRGEGARVGRWERQDNGPQCDRGRSGTTDARTCRTRALLLSILTSNLRILRPVVSAKGRGKHGGGSRHGSLIQGCGSPHLHREEVRRWRKQTECDVVKHLWAIFAGFFKIDTSFYYLMSFPFYTFFVETLHCYLIYNPSSSNNYLLIIPIYNV